MPTSPPSLLAGWHDFFVLLGAAAATLIGAQFVVVSIGIGVLTRDRSVAIRTFLSTTVIHLATVLFGGALIAIPGLDWFWLGVAAGLAGIAGVAYSVVSLFGFREHTGTVASDWFWYAVFPLVAYAVLLVVAALAWREATASLYLLAAVMAFLLLTGIRNAWDMIVFLVTRSRDST